MDFYSTCIMHALLMYHIINSKHNEGYGTKISSFKAHASAYQYWNILTEKHTSIYLLILWGFYLASVLVSLDFSILQNWNNVL